MFDIELAGLLISIDSKYESVRSYCRDYIVERGGRQADFSVRVSIEEIEGEMSSSTHPLSPAYAEKICVYRKICERLPEYGAFMLHSAVVELDGIAYAFTAPSGTGKTTHALMWTRTFGSRARIINGDKPIISLNGKDFNVWGTPWSGKEGFNINISAPLGGICFLQRGEENSIRAAGSTEKISRILPAVLIPREVGMLERIMPLIDRTTKEIPMWVLSCTVSKQAAAIAYEAMSSHVRK